MTKKFNKTILASTLALALSAPVMASSVTQVGSELITFDEAIGGLPFFNFDSSDADNATDVVFSTTDPSGFFTSGPGSEQLFVDEPGLEGTTDLDVDLRVDFLQGAVGQIAFGFATTEVGTVTFTAYNQAGAAIGTQTVTGEFFDLPDGGFDPGQEPVFDGGAGGPIGISEVSGFPENEVVVSLAAGNTAVYGEFDFQLPFEGGRYIIDDFNFTPAGEDIISVVNGALPEDPLLPGDIIIGENGVPDFEFEFPIDENGIGGLFPIFIDPIVAVGYDYTFDALNAASVLIPAALANGDADFELLLPGFAVPFALQAGVSFNLLDIDANGFDSFTIQGIDTAELLDPTDPAAFVTGLTFLTDPNNPSVQATVTMTPITVDTDNQGGGNTGGGSVPAPGTIMLLGLGLVGLRRLTRR